jgi:hypothetical protein
MSASTPPPGQPREALDTLRTRYGAASRFQSRLRQRTPPSPSRRGVPEPSRDRPEVAPPA